MTRKRSMNQLFDLTGNVALCTGAASGIGQRMAWALSQAGADVVLVGRQEDALGKAVETINAEGKGKAEGVVADLLDREALVDVVAEVARHFGAPTILTNAAGVNLRQPYDEVTSETWDITVNLNLATPFFFARACVPGMLEKGRGKIINIASIAARQGSPDSPHYSTSKAAVVSWTQSHALQMAAYNVNVNAVCPGLIWTPIWESIARKRSQFGGSLKTEGLKGKDLFDQFVKAWIPLQREQTPEDIGNIVAFLASDLAENITGQSINVDGGRFTN